MSEEKTEKTYSVLYVVPADMFGEGYGSPWIPSTEETRVEATDIGVSEDGTLWLYNGSQVAAVYRSDLWVKVVPYQEPHTPLPTTACPLPLVGGDYPVEHGAHYCPGDSG